MSLHDRIMAIATHSRTEEGAGRARERGALNVKKDALEIAREADELMDQMALTLDYLAGDPLNSGTAAVMLRRYNKWKEQTK